MARQKDWLSGGRRPARALVAVVGLALLLGLSGSRQPHLGRMVPGLGEDAVQADVVRTGLGPYNCPVPCYGPRQIRAAYELQSLLDAGVSGRGRTIVVVDAFQDPYLESDLELFDRLFGLPPAKLRVFAPQGLAPFDLGDPNQVGWSAEIALDVEWAHAIAPGAAIALVLARTDADADILRATRFAVEHNLGSVISQSFGEAERCMDPAIMRAQHELFEQATRRRITLLAASGDQGAGQPACHGSGLVRAVATPASDPLVTAVGGTNLSADLITGAYRGERAWDDGFGKSGGGFSDLFPRPPYQEGVPGIADHRGVPDVAYNAGVIGGVLVHWGVGNQLQRPPISPTDPNVFFIFGGTSAGPPQWAGITALADQLGHRRLGSLNRLLYRLARNPVLYGQILHDIVAGNNVEPQVGGFAASPGWDPVTGWGTPRGSNLVRALLQQREDEDREDKQGAEQPQGDEDHD